jgi:transaldolase
MNALSQLKTYTTVVADTGDFEAIEQYVPQDATTNPSLILQAATSPKHADVVLGALRHASRDGGSLEVQVKRAIDRVAVEFGLRILRVIPGRVSTEVDARLSFDTEKTIAEARRIIAEYAREGIERKRILIKIASTWEGIRAAEVLEREGIHCNLTLLFGLHQAIACAEAGVTLISPFVGRILDWYKKTNGRDYLGAEDPGVQSVTKIYNYFKHHGHKTEVMGASFRNTGEIIELAGCDLLTIAPSLLAELQQSSATLVRKLDPKSPVASPRIEMSESVFRQMHENDPMAKEKLKEGIEGFEKALVALEQDFMNRLRQ